MFCVFNALERAPFIVKISDDGRVKADKAIMLSKTEDAAMQTLIKVFGKDENWIRFRFPIQEVKRDLETSLRQLMVGASITKFYLCETETVVHIDLDKDPEALKSLVAVLVQ